MRLGRAHFVFALFLLSGAPVPAEPNASESGVDWGGVFRQSAAFATIQHSFRLATEPGTRDGLRGPFIRGWAESVKSLHGWADGDPFYVNYVGHPMQGGVTGFIWIQNDRAYRRVEFGRGADYWRSRLRAAGFAALYSEQFEIGPFSEASIGKIQRDYPQRGFVDHVVTPSIGLGWIVAEDAVDRYFIRAIERRVEAPWARVLLRGGLNPARSMANLMAGKVPWYRSTRPGVLDPAAGQGYRDRAAKVQRNPEATEGLAPVEVGFTAQPEWHFGSGRSCIGGAVSPAFRLSDRWQMVADIGGCKILGLPASESGDTLHYRVGPRWYARPGGSLRPHAQVLLGGIKISRTFVVDPGKKKVADGLRFEAEHRLSVAAGAGIDYTLGRAIALRLVSFEYRQAWLSAGTGPGFNRGARLSSGIVVRMGNW